MEQKVEAFALVVTEANGDSPELSPRVKSLVEDFVDVATIELSSGLQPMRDIQHCIDFVPQAVISHKSAYRMSSKEHMELQKQVHSQVRTPIENSNKKYKERGDRRCKRVVFKAGDLVWIHLKKARFLTGRNAKLQPQQMDHFGAGKDQ